MVEIDRMVVIGGDFDVWLTYTSESLTLQPELVLMLIVAEACLDPLDNLALLRCSYRLCSVVVLFDAN
jgi:hypothetical protein